MRLFTACPSKCALFVGGLAILVALAGCSTLPRPKSADNSLLVLVVATSPGSAGTPVSDRVVIEGPTPLKVNLTGGSDGVFFFRVAPGRYRVSSREIRWRGGATRTLSNPPKAEVNVEASSIVLPEWKFAAAGKQAGAGGYGVVPTMPTDRRRAAAALRDYVQVAEWAGRRVSGFAPYSPFSDYASTNFTVHVKSDPPGAKIFIDGQEWGDTPLPVPLSPGKHFIRLDLNGYEPHTSFINVGGNGTESFTLKAAPESKIAKGAAGRVPVMIEPFANLSGSQYDNLAGVLTNSLSVALRHAGIDVVAGGQSGSGSEGKTRTADFAAAEKSGALAFVAGDYSANEQSILIHAALYDTRTRLVKASVIFNGEGGVSIFDSIDRVSSDLSKAVEKALPEVGQAVVQERVITPEEATFSARVHEQDVIRKRNEKRYSIAVGPNLAGVFDQLVDPTNPTNVHDRMNGPALGIKAGMDFPLSGRLSLHLETMPLLFPDATGNMKVEIPVYFGPRLNFSGYMSDVYLGLQGALHFAPKSTVDFTGTPVTVGPFWLTGLNFETGVKIYTYRKLSDLPTYFGVGLRLGIFGYRFDLNLSNAVSYPMEVGMGIYWGTRL